MRCSSLLCRGRRRSGGRGCLRNRGLLLDGAGGTCLGGGCYHCSDAVLLEDSCILGAVDVAEVESAELGALREDAADVLDHGLLRFFIRDHSYFKYKNNKILSKIQQVIIFCHYFIFFLGSVSCL